MVTSLVHPQIVSSNWTVVPFTTSSSWHLGLLRLNHFLLEESGPNDTLSARISSYELAARMQLAVPEVTSIEGETDKTRENYGLNKNEIYFL